MDAAQFRPARRGRVSDRGSALRDEIINEVLPRFLNDHVKARELQADGTYLRLNHAEGETASQAQLYFRERPAIRRGSCRIEESPFQQVHADQDSARKRTRMKKKILVVDIGGTHVKLMISRTDKRKFDSGPSLLAETDCSLKVTTRHGGLGIRRRLDRFSVARPQRQIMKTETSRRAGSGAICGSS